MMKNENVKPKESQGQDLVNAVTVVHRVVQVLVSPTGQERRES